MGIQPSAVSQTPPADDQANAVVSGKFTEASEEEMPSRMRAGATPSARMPAISSTQRTRVPLSLEPLKSVQDRQC